MCFRGGSASPLTSGDDSSSLIDETMASARASYNKSKSDSVDDRRAARTRSLMSGPLTANTIRSDAMSSSGTKSSGITRKSLLSYLL